MYAVGVVLKFIFKTMKSSKLLNEISEKPIIHYKKNTKAAKSGKLGLDKIIYSHL